jgi:hypothetical protein
MDEGVLSSGSQGDREGRPASHRRANRAHRKLDAYGVGFTPTLLTIILDCGI